MDKIDESSLSAPSDFTENMTMYMAEDFDISRWRKERKSKKQTNRTQPIKSAAAASMQTKEVRHKENKISEKDTPVEDPIHDHDDYDEEEDEAESAGSRSSQKSSRHPTSTLDLPGFAWPVSGDVTEEHETTKTQQMLTRIQDLQFQVEQTQSEKTLLQEENNKFRSEISQLRDQFAELAEQLAEFQVEYDALQKERHTIAKVLMHEWGMKETGPVRKAGIVDGVGFKYT